MNDYFSVYPGTPPLGVKGDYRCSVHWGSTYRLDCARKQVQSPAVPVEKIVDYVKEFLGSIGIIISKSPVMKPSEIDYERIKADNNLADERDIVWMKFTKDGYLGVVATSNDVNFDIPVSKHDYDSKERVYNSYKRKYEEVWKHNSSGILVHQLQKEWDTSFVLIFPLQYSERKYERGDIERAVGNFLISKAVPIIDFYSHNY